MYFLFAVVFMMDGTYTTRYPDQMTYLECMSKAKEQVEIMNQLEKQEGKTEYFCGTNEQFVKEYL